MLTKLYFSVATSRLADGILPDTHTDKVAPGQAALQDVTNTVRTWSLIGCVIAIIIAAVLWAWGSQSQNAAQATQGKKGIIVAIVAAAVIVAATTLVKWGMHVGTGFSFSS